MPVKNRLPLFKRILSSRLFLVISIIVLVLIGVALSKEIYRETQVRKETNSLESEISRLTKRNSELSELILYFNTVGFEEKQARLKLGLQKPGEKVVILPEAGNINGELGTVSGELPAAASELSNPKKWWNFFFYKNI